MKPDTEAPDALVAVRPRRGVRLFIALHVGAVGTIYAIALIVGGGFAGPPMPPLTVVMAQPPTTPAPLAPAVAAQRAPTFEPAPLPEWARRVEITAPWESR